MIFLFWFGCHRSMLSYTVFIYNLIDEILELWNRREERKLWRRRKEKKKTDTVLVTNEEKVSRLRQKIYDAVVEYRTAPKYLKPALEAKKFPAMLKIKNTVHLIIFI